MKIHARAVLVLVAAMLAAHSTCRADEKGYPIPSIAHAKLIFAETQLVADVKPAVPVEIKTYREPDGAVFRTYSVKDVIFRYDVYTNAERTSGYSLVDKNGDGVFETKEELVGKPPEGDGGQKYIIAPAAKPSKELKYGYENVKRPSIREQKDLLMGYPVYVPAWVLLRFNIP